MPGAASRKRATSSGLKTTGTLRGSCMNKGPKFGVQNDGYHSDHVTSTVYMQSSRKCAEPRLLSPKPSKGPHRLRLNLPSRARAANPLSRLGRPLQSVATQDGCPLPERAVVRSAAVLAEQVADFLFDKFLGVLHAISREKVDRVSPSN
jgi:hypothetical protein